MRRAAGWLFLALLAVGLFWPVAAVALPCGKCCDGCEEGSRRCGTMPGSFSLCCLTSQAPLPTVLAMQVALAPGALVEALSPALPLAADPRPILHVPLS